MPYFLLYIGDNFEDPYGIGPDELDMLPQYLAQVIKDTEKLWNNQRVPSREPPASSMLHDL